MRTATTLGATLLLVFGFESGELSAQQDFIRGDINCNGCVNLIDAYDLLVFLSRGGTLPCDCVEARDVNCDGNVDLSDSIILLNHLVLSGAPPCAPYPDYGPSPGTTGLTCPGYPNTPLFRRGDANQDGCVNGDDARFVLDYLFNGGPAPACLQAADANDDDVIDSMDAGRILSYTSGGSPPPAPGPFVGGDDPTPGVLTCLSYPRAVNCTGCRNQLPSDCNQDGTLDITDSVCLLNLLFTSPVPLPCGDGKVGHPGNILLLDANGDLAVDLTDAVGVLNFLFLGGPPPVRGTSCIYIESCSRNKGCPPFTP